MCERWHPQRCCCIRLLRVLRSRRLLCSRTRRFWQLLLCVHHTIVRAEPTSLLLLLLLGRSLRRLALVGLQQARRSILCRSHEACVHVGHARCSCRCR